MRPVITAEKRLFDPGLLGAKYGPRRLEINKECNPPKLKSRRALQEVSAHSKGSNNSQQEDVL
jgi:hypothetical protein